MSTTNCPSRDAMRDYLVGKLPDAPSDALAGHLESCLGCQAELATLADADDTLVARLRGPVAPDAYLEEPACGEALARAKAVVGAGQAPGDAEEDASAILVLEQLGDYQLLGELGRGSMGRVYKALHRKLERLVAMKILPGGRIDDPQAVARFQREMKAIGRLDHPNIVRAYDAREVQGRPVLVMEYLEGLDVGAVVRRLGPMGVAEACEVARQAACGLECAHEHGLVHRDVKPSNLMLTPQGQVKLLDLGLARFHRGPASGEEVTGTGQAMGTADYIAPEQAADSREVDIRADVYSLGCTLYKMLCGRAPFGGPQYAGPLEKMMAHVREPVPPLGQLNPGVPEGLVAVVERMLAKDPEARYGTPAEVAEALAPWCAGSDLPGLLARAAAVVEEPTLAPGAASQRPPRAVAAQPAEPLPQPAPRPWKRAAVLVGLILLSLGIGLLLGIVIRIENDGRKITIETTPEEGGAKGPDTGVNLPAISPAKPGPSWGEAAKPPAAPGAAAADVAADEKAILGTWEVVSSTLQWIESLKDCSDEEVVKTTQIVVTKDAFKIQGAHVVNAIYGYQLAPASPSLPGEMGRQKLVEFRRVGEGVLGIYELHGNELKVCLYPKRQATGYGELPAGPPRTFRPLSGRPTELMVLRRVGDAAIEPEENAIQGTWEVVDSSREGPADTGDLPPSSVFSQSWLKNVPKGMRVCFRRHSLSFLVRVPKLSRDYPPRPLTQEEWHGYAIVPSAKPKIIDVIDDGLGRAALGTYELQGDALRIRLASFARPADLRPPYKPEELFLSLRRVKPGVAAGVEVPPRKGNSARHSDEGVAQ